LDAVDSGYRAITFLDEVILDDPEQGAVIFDYQYFVSHDMPSPII
jgi:hypothetical protein